MQQMEFVPLVESDAQLVQIQQLVLIASLNIIFQVDYVLFAQISAHYALTQPIASLV